MDTFYAVEAAKIVLVEVNPVFFIYMFLFFLILFSIYLKLARIIYF